MLPDFSSSEDSLKQEITWYSPAYKLPSNGVMCLCMLEFEKDFMKDCEKYPFFLFIKDGDGWYCHNEDGAHTRLENAKVRFWTTVGFGKDGD